MKKLCCTILLLLVMQVGVSAAGGEGTSLRVLGSNGTTTVGFRITRGAGEPETDGTNVWPTDLTELVYTTDGVNWSKGTLDGELRDVTRGGYNGTEFLAYAFASHWPTYRSKDGVHWTEIPEEDTWTIPTCSEGYAELGSYRFELDGAGELYLVSGDRAALLPDVGRHNPEEGGVFSAVKAYYVPGGVRVEVYPNHYLDFIGEPYVRVYPTSSLDWVIENQSDISWYPEELVSEDNGRVYLRKLAVGTGGERWEASVREEEEGEIQWRPIQAIWCQDWNGATLLPWNGRSFLILDRWSLQLYASEDGLNWRCLGDTFLAPELNAGMHAFAPVNYSSHALTWTGSEYMACRRTAEGRYGMVGSSGGSWHSPYCTKVCFADENFNLTGAYDFERQVESVGYRNGVYYAEVSRSVGLDDPGLGMDGGYSREAGTDLYRSTDKLNWEKTELTQIFDAMRTRPGRYD